jgi:hypothetical protein
MLDYNLCYSCKYYQYKDDAYCLLFKRFCKDLKKECNFFEKKVDR